MEIFKKYKKVFYVILAVLVLTIIILFVFNTISSKNSNQNIYYVTSEDGSKTNNNRQVAAVQRVGQFTVQDCTIEYKNGETNFKANIINNSKLYQGLKLKVTFVLDGTNNTVEKEITVGDLYSKESKLIELNFSEDLSNTHYVRYLIVK